MTARRLPVYLVLDTSGSMAGEPIEAVNNGIRTLISTLSRDPHALETVHISIITFDRTARLVMPLTSLDELNLPTISTPDSGPTHMGEALQLLEKQFKSEVIQSTSSTKGDWAPFALVMTDGKASDRQVFNEMAPQVKKLGFKHIVGCLAGDDASENDLGQFCDPVLRLATMDSAAFDQLFTWVSTAVSGENKSLGTSKSVELPPPPKEITL